MAKLKSKTNMLANIASNFIFGSLKTKTESLIVEGRVHLVNIGEVTQLWRWYMLTRVFIACEK